jgi:hypothetical protein
MAKRLNGWSRLVTTNIASELNALKEEFVYELVF